MTVAETHPAAAADPGAESEPGAASHSGAVARVARLSYFFPAHNEAANLAGLVEEALATLPSLAETFEIIAVDDGSRDATASIVEGFAERHPGIVRLVRHPVNLGYGSALRSECRSR